jgi:hypothetical protein
VSKFILCDCVMQGSELRFFSYFFDPNTEENSRILIQLNKLKITFQLEAYFASYFRQVNIRA